MREDIAFNAEGTTLRGWLYTPDRGPDPFPCVVMAHGFSAVKEMYLDSYAEVFAQAGLAALVFDNRNFGESDGEPRQEIDPWVQIHDYRHAITYLGTRLEIDRERIGVWGSSYSGGHVLVVGALDRRVKCVVSQVPLTNGYHNIQRLVRADVISTIRELFNNDREARFAGMEPTMIAVVTNDPQGMAALPTPDSYTWFTETGDEIAPNWNNEVTLRTVEMLMEYEPGSYIERISPTPLLMLIAAQDHLAVAEEAFITYNRALEPKKLVILPGGHFTAYTGSGFELSSSSARDWFVQHLIDQHS